jgi:hypothetical protein
VRALIEIESEVSAPQSKGTSAKKNKIKKERNI